MYGSVVEGGVRGAASRLWLEGRVRGTLTVMLGGDAGWRLGRRDSGVNLDPKTQTHRCVHLSDGVST